MISEDKVMFNAVDENKDGVLNFKEFVMFFNPEDYPKMHPIIIEQTLKEKDLDYDGKISFQEFLGDKGNNILNLILLTFAKDLCKSSN